jgi:small-conductance mechanosensitive channel
MQLVELVRGVLESFVTTDARVAVSAVLLTLAGVFGLLVTPWAISRFARVVRQRLRRRSTDTPGQSPDSGDGQPSSVDEPAGGGTPPIDWQIPVVAATRTVQAGLFLGTALALLVTWGHVDLALAVTEILGGLLPTAARLALTVGLVVGAFEGTGLLERRLSAYAEQSHRINQHQERVVFRVVQVVLLVAVGLTTLSIWEYNPQGVLVGAGFLGIVVGMAARQTLGSFIAGFVVMFSRPFRLGDWVVIGEWEGIVTDITILNTRIKTFDDEEVVVPNDRVVNATVTNRTRRGRLRLTVEVGVDYDTDLEGAESVVRDAIDGVDHVRRVPKPQVVPTAFGDSAVVLEVRFWIDNPSARRRWQTRAGVIRAVKEAFEREGIQIPFPQRELSNRAQVDRPHPTARDDRPARVRAARRSED